MAHMARTRFPDWVARLWTALDEANQKSYPQWMPCCAFCADIVDAITEDGRFGERLAREVPDEAAARALLAKGLQTLVTTWLGYGPYERPALAHRGDLILFNLDGIDVLGVSAGDQIMAVTEKRGLIGVPRSFGVTAWKI